MQKFFFWILIHLFFELRAKIFSWFYLSLSGNIFLLVLFIISQYLAHYKKKVNPRISQVTKIGGNF
jgi:hypothetical protein